MRWLPCLEEVVRSPLSHIADQDHDEAEKEAEEHRREEEEEESNAVFHGRVGSREGHCAAVLTAIPCTQKTTGADYVVLLGGYCEGELCGHVLAAPLAPVLEPPAAQPVLRWQTIPLLSCAGSAAAPKCAAQDGGADSAFRCVVDLEEAAAILACDGATLTSVPLTALPSFPLAAKTAATAAILFGGLNSDLDRTNRVYIVTLHAEEAEPQDRANPSTNSTSSSSSSGLSFMLHEWCTTAADAAPPPRSRHSAGVNTDGEGGSPSSLFIFGGETDDAEQTNQLYELHLMTGTWSEVTPREAEAPWPAPRHLANASLCYLPAWHVLVLYGGAHYVEGNIKSFADVWLYYTETQTWRCLVSETVERGGEQHLPPCNGHSGVVVVPRCAPPAQDACRSSSTVEEVLFVGGKESSIGDDRVKCLSFSSSDPAVSTLEEGCCCRCVCSLVAAKESGVHLSEEEDMMRRNSSSIVSETVLKVEGTEEEEEEPALSKGSAGTPHWRYMPAIVPLPLKGQNEEERMVLLLLGGQCRHEQADAAFVLFA